MKNFLERYPFFLILFPLFVIIHFEKEFNLVIKHEFIYDRIIILFAVPILSFLFFYIFFRSVLKSSLMTLGFLLVFYYTGDLRNWLSQKFPDSIWQRYTFLLPVLFSILLILFFKLKKHKSSLEKHCFAINIAFLLFIASDAVQIFLTGRQDKNQIAREGVRDLFETKFLWNRREKRHDIDTLIYNHLIRASHLKSNHPKFIYAHFMRPHPYYHFDSLGRRFSSDIISNSEAYIHQIAYSNKMIKKITDSIITYTKRPLVIIIQGDHGDKNTQQKHRAFSNFNAIYFSNNDYSLLNDSITNVNTFRIVLNIFFKKDLDLLPNKFYFVYQKLKSVARL